MESKALGRHQTNKADITVRSNSYQERDQRILPCYTSLSKLKENMQHNTELAEFGTLQTQALVGLILKELDISGDNTYNMHYLQT